MTETVSTQLKAIAFERDIERLTQNFTGREWIFKEIDRWLQQENKRFFILTGEPGVGKSAIAARLTQTRKDIAAYHFCIARQISTVEPNNVLLSLAAQLIKYFPDYGEALVNTVKPLFLKVNVEINIENIKDSIVQGVVIENLHIHYPKEALDIVLRRALAALPNPPKKPVSILIDSLDETVTYSNENNLVTLLSSVDDLPSWVRFILTSRPDKQRVLSYFETLKPYYYHLNELSEKNKKDIHQYVDGRVLSEPIQVQIQRFQVQSEALINQITELSKGNFLYTKVLLDDIELGEQPIDNLATLPKSLNELYYNFLLRLKTEWEGKYQPIFGILTVTKAPVTEEELANLLSEQLNETELGQRLRVVQQFLDVVQNDYAENTYTLFHQSLQDYLTDKEKSGVFHCSPKDGHRQIIEYCWQYHPRDWRECDRYGLRYLAIHLLDMAALEKPPIKARKYVERLHELLATEVDRRNAWFDAKDRIGETAGFLADVELAWAQADEAYDREPGKSIGLQCRYALIKTSINSLARIPTALIMILVKYKYWELVKALAYTRQISNPEDKYSSLTALAAQATDSEPLKHQILQAALQSAQAIQDAYARANALSALADKLPEALPKALESAQAIQDQSSRARVLTALTDKLPKVFPEALEAVQSIQNEFSRSEALTALADKLPPALLFQALKAAQTIRFSEYRTHALIALVNKLPEALPKALDAAQAIRNPYRHAYVLTELVNKLTPELLPKALEAVQVIQDKSFRFRALIALADKLPEALPKALEAAQAIRSEYTRTYALIALADKLPEVLPQALETAQAIQDKSSRAYALIALADKLPKILPQALETAQFIQGEYGDRARVLTSLADKLPEAIPKALEAIEVIQKTESRGSALIALVDKLTPNLLPKTLEVIQSVPYYHAKDLLTALVGKLSLDLLPKALEVAQSIENEPSRAYALIALADKLPEVLPQALEAAQAIQHEYYRVQVLDTLADKLPEALPKALEIAQAIQDKSSRAEALTALANKLPEALPKALEAAQSIENESSRVKALVTLADRLPEALPKALEATQAIQDESSRAETLTTLIDKLTPDLLPKALKVAQSIQSEYYRNQVLTSEALIALLERLGSDLLPKTLEAVQSIQDENRCIKVLAALADKFLDTPLKALETTQAIQDENFRTYALIALADKLTPDLLPRALEVVQSIQDKTSRIRAMSALTDKLPEALPDVPEAVQLVQNEFFLEKSPSSTLSTDLKSAQSILDEYDRAQALTALAGELTPDILAEALEVAQSIQDEDYRTEALVALADQFPEALPIALESIRSTQNERYRAHALFALVSNKLTQHHLPKALEIAQSIQDKYDRDQLVFALMHELDKLSSVNLDILEAVQSIQDESNRSYGLTVLVDKLTPDLLFKALEIAQCIQNGESRAYALTALADKLPEALPKALEAAQSIQNVEFRVHALIPLVDKLPEALPKALEAAQSIQYESSRAEALTVLVFHLINASDRFTIWTHLVYFLSQRTRSSLLSDLESLIPVLNTLGKKAAIADTAQAIQDVSRWWS